jgi:hypothetical protein
VEDRQVKDEQENTRPQPDGEVRPRPEGVHEEKRSLSDLAAQYGEGAVKAAGAATVYYGIKGATKLKDVLTQPEEPSKIELPPGVEK